MYVELRNKAQEISAEAYCIDKFKPYLNKALNYEDDSDDNEDCLLEMKLPKWKIYDSQNLKYKQQLLSLERENAKILEDISVLENDIKNKKYDLNKMKFELNKINYKIKVQDNVKNNNILFGFGTNDIKWFYKHCENKSVKFHSEIYDKTGELVVGGCMYYDSDINMLSFKYDEEKGIMTEKDFLFDALCSALYVYYPDINIYSELYSSLLSKKDELSIINSVYDLKDLMEICESGRVIDKERNIHLYFENGKISNCTVDLSSCGSIYRGKHRLNNEYRWNEEDGLRVGDDYIKEDIDIGIKKYLFSCKYYHPNRDGKEEKYCNEMLSKLEKCFT